MAAPPARPQLIVARSARKLHLAIAAAAWTAGAIAGESDALAKTALACRAERAGDRALVQVTVDDLFDRELLRLVELGLVGRLHTEATLYRRRGFWFDARLAQSRQVFILSWSKEPASHAHGVFRLEGGTIADPQRLALPLIALRPGDDAPADVAANDPDRDPAARYVEIKLRLEVITARSLGRVAAWLVTGDSGAKQSEGAVRTDDEAPVPKTALPRALVDYLAADLVRTASNRCAVPR